MELPAALTYPALIAVAVASSFACQKVAKALPSRMGWFDAGDEEEVFEGAFGPSGPSRLVLVTIGLIFASMLSAQYWLSGWSGETLSMLYIGIVGLIISFVDWELTIIPDSISMPLIWGGLLFSPFSLGMEDRVYGAFAGFASFLIVFYLVGKLKGVDTYAGGDVAVAAAAGAWLGVEKMVVFMGVSGVAYLVYSIPFRIRGIIWVPMGPALIIAIMTSALTGDLLLVWR